MKLYKIIILMLSSCIMTFAIDAKLEIIKKSNSIPSVYFIDFSDSFVNNKIKLQVSKLIIGDSVVSGHIKPSEYSNANSNFLTAPNYIEFKKLGTDIVVFYKIQENNSGLTLNVKTYDINTAEASYSKTYKISNLNNYPFLIHQMIIDLNDHIGAPSISWMKKLVILAKKISKNESNILVADYTLTYQKNVVKGGINIFPKWANKKQDSFYYTYLSDNKKPIIYHQSLATASKKEIISGDGLAIVSDVSQDSNNLLLTLSPKDQADIYLYNVKSKRLKQITKYRGIDVGGNFIDNDEAIVFVSNRLGNPNIFRKSIYENNTKQLVYHGKNNNSCSAFKNDIVFVSRDNARNKIFNLYLISTNSNAIKQLTSNGVNQFPSFSDDGESILFIKHYKNQSSIGVLRLNYNQSYLFPLKKGKIQSIDW